ncbi:MAG: hypothetical protein BWY16_00947 [Candidatus Omnitrophica bacterium ADurb.Bin205]|jgi:hypothetical protein|nr:MAG: hypothetical protein BWY16_00947 [Candidatus Omnitrophica bacterium ADurb.Bin205]RJP27370.1 MAG: hypothetical protein C4533_07885 [Candidatus Omnitrophota bacterium]
MSRNVILNIGDTIKYSGECTGIIEKIRIISTGNYIEQYEYNGNGEDIVLTLRNDHGITNLWLKDTSISKIF